MHARQAVVGGAVAVLAGGSLAFAAPRGPSLNESDATVRVPSTIRAVVVDVDSGNVTVAAGTPRGSVHKRWDVEEPTVTTTVKNGVLRVVGRCSENQVVVASTVYVGMPLRPCSVDVVLAVPRDVSVEIEGDALSVTGTRGSVQAKALEAVDVVGAGPGAVQVVSYTDGVRVVDSTPSRLDARANGLVQLSAVRAGRASVTSDTGDVRLMGLSAGRLDVLAGGAVSVVRSTADALTARSYTSNVSLSATRVRGALVAEANNGLVTEGVRAATARLQSDTGTLEVRGCRFTELRGEAGNAVTAELAAAPRHVRLTSSTSSLSLRVPSTSYAVTARSDTGRVTIRGIVVDAKAPRSLELHANRDVTVN
jgi:hypothetical protein